MCSTRTADGMPTGRRPAARRPTAMCLVSLLAASALHAEVVHLQIKGSDTIGGALGPALASAFEAQNPGIDVEWESLGSGTAFVGLFDGSADLGASSRSIKEKELEEAGRLGLRLKEYVLGYDGIAVLVHPSNPVAELTIPQLSDVFTGKVRRWSEVGGPELPIRLISRPDYSGTHGFFKNTVVRRGDKNGPEEFAPETRYVEHSADIVREVAGDPAAIAYLGMGWIRDSVKAVSVAAAAGEPAILPSETTVRDGSYPIYRPLLLYTRGEPRGELRRLMSFILAGEGQALVAEHDFIASDAPCTVCRMPAGEGSGGEEIEVTRIFFGSGGTRLDQEARNRLFELARQLEASRQRALVVGHADSDGSREVNQRIALSRAQVVAGYLSRLGVPAERLTIESKGSSQPIATNDTREGRRHNRRVDVRLLGGGGGG